MKGLVIFFFFFFFSLFSLLKVTESAAERNNGVYIVYMGAAAASSNKSSREDHAQLISSVLKRNQNGVIHSYTKSFTGFSARLLEEEARLIARKPGVISVFPDPILKLKTTRSWDFLDYQTTLETESDLSQDSNLKSGGTDTIIALIDTGIWPESESFNDKGMGPIPSRWKGTCTEGHNFSSSNCNRKLIGARYYMDSDELPEEQSPRDSVGHGTHVASTAAGSHVPGASYYGLAKGTARGGSPGSRIAVYKVCTLDGCSGSALLAAFDDAIADGVDVVSLSIGADLLYPPDFLEDPIAIGAFHAMEKGITVVCAGGNDGPAEETVSNIAPWILTVAASTIDREFQSNVMLGNTTVIKGESINFASIKRSPVYPLTYGGWAKLSDSEDDFYASNCNAHALDADKIKGKIVVCQNDDDSFDEKRAGVMRNGGIGIIVINDDSRSGAFNSGADPITVINSDDAAKILSYINSSSDPVGTILPTVTMVNFKPAPQVAVFSSRGPSTLMRNILKPDIAAPGVDILAAWMADDSSAAPKGMKPPLFNIISGTSMACPHVSGIAATVKSRHPTWSPSAIRSAIMTTATQTNNMRAPIMPDYGSVATEPGRGSVATPYDVGAGEVSTSGSLEPGLVYDMDEVDYLTFLCNYGYNLWQIKIISPTLPQKFSCPKDSKDAHISNMNYPSIAISDFDGKGSKKISRTVTNVGGSEETIYTAMVNAPNGLSVKVVPAKLLFTKGVKKLSYAVIFNSTTSSLPKKDMFGAITWINGKYKVRSPFVVSNRASRGHWI